jgi:hypothetical protein
MKHSAFAITAPVFVAPKGLYDSAHQGFSPGLKAHKR